MVFALQLDKSLRKGLRQLARQQLDEVLSTLGNEQTNTPDEAVHEVRKAFKRLRALLRLVRPVIGDAPYHTTNRGFRDAARPLTEVRDARVLRDTLDHLTQYFAEHVQGKTFDAVRTALEANLETVRQRVLVEQQTFAHVSDAIRQARKRVKGWTDVPNRWLAISDGLEEVYRRARAARTAVAADPTVEKLHEWRKQTKYLRHQLEALRPLEPARLGALAETADRLGELLGVDHDLVVLRQWFTDNPTSCGGNSDREMLLALIASRRTELEQQALQRSEPLFADKPRTFLRRLKPSWRHRGEVPADQPTGVPAEPVEGVEAV